jgi:hypothetical protein
MVSLLVVLCFVAREIYDFWIDYHILHFNLYLWLVLLLFIECVNVYVKCEMSN